MAFVEQWDDYLDKHPAVQRIVDPDYVSFDFSGGVPDGFATDLAASDARIGVLATVRVDGAASPSVFFAQNREMAMMLAGRMRALHPAVFATVFTSNAITFW
jgi:hypothetical protein